MPRSFEVSAESPASVEEVLAAFGGEDYWLARFAAFDADSTLDSLVVDVDGTITVNVTQHLTRRLLPGPIAKLVSGDLNILHTETWQPLEERRVHGQISVVAPAALGSGRGVALLTPSGGGSRLEFAATVEFKVPLIGGRIETSVARQFAEGIPEIQRFTTGWVIDHV